MKNHEIARTVGELTRIAQMYAGCEQLRGQIARVIVPLLSPAPPAPIDMVLHCPRCSCKHIDAPSGEWTNPPHRSHLCHHCGFIWRPADVPTNGVAWTKTRGKDDS